MTENRRSEHSHETPGISVYRPYFPDGVELSIHILNSIFMPPSGVGAGRRAQNWHPLGLLAATVPVSAWYEEDPKIAPYVRSGHVAHRGAQVCRLAAFA